ncbi:hypothetical protein BWQ93_14770 [Sphingopyxis sp. QXT-31]|uniref:hypothetical protein n=1 Tax=Sphingopyxis sp. QXT-31 TaxID=1357916 RepID=UPI00097931B8|nr:hypothetical protein [Sphingopyxis sp. QXT-31]APZ99608.1 hypothetical protein BWQ93_14770 [Sphingopyxis sp. QXT-31]
MTRTLLPLFLSGGMLMLAACGDSADKAAPEEKASVAPATDAEPAPPPPAPEPTPAEEYQPDPAMKPPAAVEAGIGSGEKAIPAAIQGRWALNAADCPKRPGTDLTALVIDAANLRFHESHGELARVRERSANRIVADYKFSGEGMDWDRLMMLSIADGGKTLVRRDYGEGAAANAMRYTRCAA